jgi:hypothetical protein
VIIRHLVDGNGRVAGDGYLYFTVGFPGRAAALSEPRSSTHTHPNTVTSLHSPHSMPLDDGQRVPIITHPKPSLHQPTSESRKSSLSPGVASGRSVAYVVPFTGSRDSICTSPCVALLAIPAPACTALAKSAQKAKDQDLVNNSTINPQLEATASRFLSAPLPSLPSISYSQSLAANHSAPPSR